MVETRHAPRFLKAASDHSSSKHADHNAIPGNRCNGIGLTMQASEHVHPVSARCCGVCTSNLGLVFNVKRYLARCLAFREAWIKG
ncbi:unnamed protein product [Ixodes pacificus]